MYFATKILIIPHTLMRNHTKIYQFEKTRLQFVALYVAVASEPFIDAAQDGTVDVTEVAVAEVQKELFQGTDDFHTGMAPCIDTVKTVFVGYMLNDIAGMAQGEL